MARHVPPRERRIREMMAEAHALLRKERPLNARLRCQQVLALEPDRVDALMLLGALAGRGGDTAEARDLLARAAVLRPDDPQVHNNLGNAMAGLECFDDALVHYERALALAPDHAQAHDNRRALRALLRDSGRDLPLDPLLDGERQPTHRRFLDDDPVDGTLTETDTMTDAPPTPDGPDMRAELMADALRHGGVQLNAIVLDLDCGLEAVTQALCGLSAHVHGIAADEAAYAVAQAAGLHVTLAQAPPLAHLAGLTSAIDVLATAQALGRSDAPLADWFSAATAALRPGGLWVLAVDDAAAALPWLGLGQSWELADLQAAAATAGLQWLVSGSGGMRHVGSTEVHGHLVLLRKPRA